MQTEVEEMRAWVGCLACYNGGRLVGRWVPGTEAGEITPDDLHDGPTDHEELWCFDLDAYPSGAEEMSPADAQAMAERHEELREEMGDDLDAFAAYLDNEHKTLTEADDDDLDEFRDAFRGEWDSLAAYAEWTAAECDEIPSRWPFYCIDWERAGEEMRRGGDVWTANAGGGCVWVFSD
jgi:hypothetical protein